MNEGRVLGAEHLTRILRWVIRMHGDITRGLATNVSEIAVSQLAENLDVITGVDVSSDLHSLAQTMANIATMVNHAGKVVLWDSPQAPARVDELEQRICAEFSIACVVAFARSYGYNIPLETMPHSKLLLALRLTKDWQHLVELFTECLQAATGLTDVQASEDEPGEIADVVIQEVERQFAEVSPIPVPSAAQASRQLSAESYWNLRSVADQESWTSEDVLMLIEEHLSPALHSHLVYHSSTVSGADWRLLYNWKHWQDGGM